MDTKLIVWSKDRACQLHLLLESLETLSLSKNDQLDIEVIYRASNESFNDAYKKVNSIFGKVTFSEEASFQKDTQSALNTDHQNIAFSTDDTVCFKTFSLDGLSLNEGDVFSLRLGLNTLVQDPYKGMVQTPLNRYSKGILGGIPIISWNPLDYHPSSNYGYPGGLDLHIFNRKKIQGILGGRPFKNTNELEAILVGARLHFSSITSFKNSVAVNIPCNNMSGITQSGEVYSYSTQYLNDLYLKGFKVNLSRIMSENFVGCHQEVKFNMVKCNG